MRNWILAGILTVVWSGCAQGQDTPPRRMVEMAYYQVAGTDADRLDTDRAPMYAAVSRYPGFVSGRTYRSRTHPHTYVDYFIWEDLDSALQAAEAVMQDEAALPFMRHISQIPFYGHANPVSPGRADDMPDAPHSLHLRIYAAAWRAEEHLADAAGDYADSVLADLEPDFASTVRFIEYPQFFMDYFAYDTAEAASAARHALPGTRERARYLSATQNVIADDVFDLVRVQIGPAGPSGPD